MSKRNQYSFSKRQRELKKKKKAEEKRLKKQGLPPPDEDGFLPDVPAEPTDDQGEMDSDSTEA